MKLNNLYKTTNNMFFNKFHYMQNDMDKSQINFIKK